MNPVPFFPQERPESCVPACLRMILAYYELECTEAEIYTCCEADVEGTLPSMAARCAQRLGFIASAPRLSNFDALSEQLETTQIFPIVYMNLSPLLGVNVIHAMIVEALDQASDQVQLIDPAYPTPGRRVLPQSLFEISWQLARRQTILIMSRA